MPDTVAGRSVPLALTRPGPSADPTVLTSAIPVWDVTPQGRVLATNRLGLWLWDESDALARLSAASDLPDLNAFRIYTKLVLTSRLRSDNNIAFREAQCALLWPQVAHLSSAERAVSMESWAVFFRTLQLGKLAPAAQGASVTVLPHTRYLVRLFLPGIPASEPHVAFLAHVSEIRATRSRTFLAYRVGYVPHDQASGAVLARAIDELGTTATRIYTVREYQPARYEVKTTYDNIDTTMNSERDQAASEPGQHVLTSSPPFAAPETTAAEAGISSSAANEPTTKEAATAPPDAYSADAQQALDRARTSSARTESPSPTTLYQRSKRVPETHTDLSTLPEAVIMPGGYAAYPVSVVAAQVGWSTKHVRELAETGRVRAAKVGRNYVVSLDDVLRYRATPKPHRGGRPRKNRELN